jgi:hypothetical protein
MSQFATACDLMMISIQVWLVNMYLEFTAVLAAIKPGRENRK